MFRVQFRPQPWSHLEHQSEEVEQFLAMLRFEQKREVEMGFSFSYHLSEYSNEYITVRTASEISGFNEQYLRRLLRENTFRSKRLGQLWLIDRGHLMSLS